VLAARASADELVGHEFRIHGSGRTFMKQICAALGMAAAFAVGLGAQSGTTKTTTKVEVKDGKNITIDGCLESNPGGGYMLSKHLGHRIQVKGKAADRGDGKVKIQSTTGTSGSNDTTKTDTELKGSEMAGMKYLGVKSVKMISKSCD
jgi:hypothetical protein